MNEDELRNLRSIHIDIPDDAPPEEAQAFDDALADFVALWMEGNPGRGAWDPFMYSHTEACEHSDHCYGPGSNEERRIKAEALREAANAYGPAQISGLFDSPSRYTQAWLMRRAGDIEAAR